MYFWESGVTCSCLFVLKLQHGKGQGIDAINARQPQDAGRTPGTLADHGLARSEQLTFSQVHPPGDAKPGYGSGHPSQLPAKLLRPLTTAEPLDERWRSRAGP